MTSVLHRAARACALGAVVVSLLSTEREARAQATTPAVIPSSNGGGFDTHLFRPAMDSKGLFTVNGSDILGKNDVSFGLVIDYGHALLRTPYGGQLVDHSFQGTLQFNYGLANMFVVGLDLPIDLMSGGQQLDSNGNPQPVYTNLWGPDKLAFQGIGYVGAHAKWRITKVEHGFGLALGVQVGDGLSGSAQNAAADNGFWYWPQIIAEKRFGSKGQFRIAVNAGYRGHSATQTKLPLEDGGVYADGDLFTFNGGVSWRVLEGLDLVGETYGTYLLASGADSDARLSNEAVGGIKVFVERNSYLML
ncbi:MAG: OmpA family protein, partial [Polyangiaceae bacterium]